MLLCVCSQTSQKGPSSKFIVISLCITRHVLIYQLNMQVYCFSMNEIIQYIISNVYFSFSFFSLAKCLETHEYFCIGTDFMVK